MALSHQDFNKTAVLEAEIIYREAVLAGDQRQILNKLSSLMAKQLPVRELAIRGFAIKAAIKWQRYHKNPVSTLMHATFDERVSFMAETLSYMKEMFRFILNNQEKSAILDAAFKNILDEYIEKYASRSFSDD